MKALILFLGILFAANTAMAARFSYPINNEFRTVKLDLTDSNVRWEYSISAAKFLEIHFNADFGIEAKTMSETIIQMSNDGDFQNFSPVISVRVDDITNQEEKLREMKSSLSHQLLPILTKFLLKASLAREGSLLEELSEKVIVLRNEIKKY
jgi:hypothetical protein